MTKNVAGKKEAGAVIDDLLSRAAKEAVFGVRSGQDSYDATAYGLYVAAREFAALYDGACRYEWPMYHDWRDLVTGVAS